MTPPMTELDRVHAESAGEPFLAALAELANGLSDGA